MRGVWLAGYAHPVGWLCMFVTGSVSMCMAVSIGLPVCLSGCMCDSLFVTSCSADVNADSPDNLKSWRIVKHTQTYFRYKLF